VDVIKKMAAELSHQLTDRIADRLCRSDREGRTAIGITADLRHRSGLCGQILERSVQGQIRPKAGTLTVRKSLNVRKAGIIRRMRNFPTATLTSRLDQLLEDEKNFMRVHGSVCGVISRSRI